MDEDRVNAGDFDAALAETRDEKLRFHWRLHAVQIERKGESGYLARAHSQIAIAGEVDLRHDIGNRKTNGFEEMLAHALIADVDIGFDLVERDGDPRCAVGANFAGEAAKGMRLNDFAGFYGQERQARFSAGKDPALRRDGGVLGRRLGGRRRRGGGRASGQSGQDSQNRCTHVGLPKLRITQLAHSSDAAIASRRL